MSTGLSVHEKKFKIDFQDGHHDGQFRFPIRTISIISDLQVKCPDTSYQVSSQLNFLVLEKQFKIDFQDGGHGGHL